MNPKSQHRDEDDALDRRLEVLGALGSGPPPRQGRDESRSDRLLIHRILEEPDRERAPRSAKKAAPRPEWLTAQRLIAIEKQADRWQHDAIHFFRAFELKTSPETVSRDLE